MPHALPLPAALPQDHDGSHIKGLLMNYFHHFYPSLLKLPGFLVEFITPIIKVRLGLECGTGLERGKTGREERLGWGGRGGGRGPRERQLLGPAPVRQQRHRVPLCSPALPAMG